MFREGVININKPADWTSQDICAKLRGRLKIKKIGHTGTLDPMATGVLPVCIGKATRIIEYYDMDTKTYVVTMQLGIRTDTLDITGEILEKSSYSCITEENITETINSFIGDIEQIPPKYSAIRINGKRAYDLARKGVEFEIKPRKVIIESIKALDIDLETGIIKIEVTCSKGTYIRTLCDDIGEKLGCFATMTELIRTRNGYFDIDNAIEINELVDLSDDEINKLIFSPEQTLTKLGTIELINNSFTDYKNGKEIFSDNYKILYDTKYENIYIILFDNEFVGIARIVNNILKPEKVILFENN